MRRKEVKDCNWYGGSTANIVVIKDDIVYCASVGDSCCMINNNNNIIWMSEKDLPDNKDEGRRIKKAGGYVVEG